MSKHTLGPWQVSGSHIYANDKALLAVAQNPGNKSTDYPLIENARLIAAAPELLEALRLLVSIYDQNITGHLVEDAFNKAREIIAKAKGEQTK